LTGRPSGCSMGYAWRRQSPWLRRPANSGPPTLPAPESSENPSRFRPTTAARPAAPNSAYRPARSAARPGPAGTQGNHRLSGAQAGTRRVLAGSCHERRSSRWARPADPGLRRSRLERAARAPCRRPGKFVSGVPKAGGFSSTRLPPLIGCMC